MTTEYDLNVANTKAFIGMDPSVVSIKRNAVISDGAGGRISGAESTVRANETVRMIPQGADNATSNPITQTTNGQLDRPDFVMLGMPGLGLQREDYFDWNGDTWEIISIRPSPVYETKADVRIRKDG